MIIGINEFKNILIFKWRDVHKALENENRNISNTNEHLLNFIEEFEVQLDYDNSIQIHSENGENELGVCDVILYDTKNKSFIIENDEFYYTLKEVYKRLKELKELI